MAGLARWRAASHLPRRLALLSLWLIIAAATGTAVPVRASWTPDGVPIAVAANDQRHPVLVPDGAGGTILVWWDDRATDIAIYAQRVDQDANLLWGPNGIVVANVEWVTVDPVAVSDGIGGVYVIWSDSRAGHPDSHLYAQRIAGDGSPLWTAGGIEVCPGGGGQYYPAAVTDFRPQVGLNTPGVIVVWEDTRIFGSFNVYTQHLDMNGTRLWGAAGLGLGNSGALEYPVITTDGTASPFFSAGAIVAWQTAAGDIRSNWINANGVVQWGADGLAVCTASGIQDEPAIASVGPRRAIIAWEDARSGVTGLDVYAQRVDNGAVSWTTDGVSVCGLAGDQYGAQVAPAAGGAFVVWQDARDPDEVDIYGQRLDPNGAPLWSPNGIVVCDVAGPQVSPEITVDGEGGAFVVWTDSRGGARGDDTDLYAQRLTDGGAAQWPADGIPVSSAGGDQKTPEILLNGSFLFVVWEDTRNGMGDNVYAGRLTGAGTVAVAASVPATELRVRLLSANPQSGLVRVGVELPAATRVAAEVVDATGRRVRTLGGTELAAGGHVLAWDGRDAAGAAQPHGVYFVRLTAGAQASTLKLVRLP